MHNITKLDSPKVHLLKLCQLVTHPHQEGIFVIEAEHPATDIRVCGHDHVFPDNAVPGESSPGVAATNSH